VIKLDDVLKGYVDVDKGTAKKLVLDPTCCWQRELLGYGLLIGPNETFGSAVLRIDKHDVLRIAAWGVD
jgi:hypothetical protein